MRRIVFLAAITVGTTAATQTFAQDWLGTHLDTLQGGHVREHQQRMLSDPLRKGSAAENRSSKDPNTKKGPGCSSKARPPSERRRMEREYISLILKDRQEERRRVVTGARTPLVAVVAA
jgi:hypothetical protein